VRYFSSLILIPVIIDADSGWIEGVRVVPSPNHDARPAGCGLDLIVVHGISLPPGEFGGGFIDRLFTNVLPAGEHPYFAEICDLRVSAHALVARNGALTQYVSFNERAWHAGDSSHCGRGCCNDYSVGIELEGTDDMPYEQAQYRRLSELVWALRASYASLRDADIVGHCDIAPGRKTDPGACFDWSELHRLIEASTT